MADPIIIDVFQDATISSDSRDSLGRDNDGLIGSATTKGYRFLCAFDAIAGAIEQAVLRLRAAGGVVDGFAKEPALLCIVALEQTSDFDEDVVNRDSPDGVTIWPGSDYQLTAQTFDPGMVDFLTPMVTLPWPEVFGEIDLDVTPILQNYPRTNPARWRFMLFSSDESDNTSMVSCGQKDFEDGDGPQLIVTLAELENHFPGKPDRTRISSARRSRRRVSGRRV